MPIINALPTVHALPAVVHTTINQKKFSIFHIKHCKF